MKNSEIIWTDHTFNAWLGCTKVSAGCKNCYAEADMDKRRGRVVWGVHGTRSVTSYSYWREPLKWNREAQKKGIRKRVFCASNADVFEDWNGQVINSKQEPLWWPEYGNFDADMIPVFATNTTEKEGSAPLTLPIVRAWLMELIRCTPYLDWLLLTKRPENIMGMVHDSWRQQFPANVWIGTSVEDQEAADKRIPELLKVPAVVRFLSCEPLLGPLGISGYLGQLTSINNETDKVIDTLGRGIQWVIIGGESGHNARRMQPWWATNIILQCEVAKVPVLFKQWGEYDDYGRKVGKKQSGRIINGRTYDGLPVISQK